MGKLGPLADAGKRLTLLIMIEKSDQKVATPRAFSPQAHSGFLVPLRYPLV
jgi:hypothetical protein